MLFAPSHFVADDGGEGEIGDGDTRERVVFTIVLASPGFRLLSVVSGV